MRGTLDEGAPAAIPGTYLNGFYETLPIPYADRGYGDPEFNQMLVGVTDGTPIRLIVEGEPLHVGSGTVLEHERRLDLRTGMLLRSLRWRSPGGHEVALSTRRLVSLRWRELAAIEYEIETTRPVRLIVHSELASRAVAGPQRSVDPRSGSGLSGHSLIPRLAFHDGNRALLVHETRATSHVVAAGMEHVVAIAGMLVNEHHGGARATATAGQASGLPLGSVRRPCAPGRRRPEQPRTRSHDWLRRAGCIPARCLG